MRGPKGRRGHLGSSLEACMILGPVDRGERERESAFGKQIGVSGGAGERARMDSQGTAVGFLLSISWRNLGKLETPALKDAQTAWGGRMEGLGVTGGIDAGALLCTSRGKCSGSLLARRVTHVQPPAARHEVVNTGHSQGY